MMNPVSGLAEKGIERMLELSAEAQIQRRQAKADSPSFHHLTGVIAACGKALGVLTALQQREEFFAIVSPFTRGRVEAGLIQ